ncbi:MAG: hypothetical protein OEN02_19190, partial [Gammaproteobacteria bacterium]|nr:hypothetical protein [Gammaproteobacteria bacterium]
MKIGAIMVIVIAASICSEARANIERQRQLFHDAASALERNQVDEFNSLLEQLAGYPAKAYLEYDYFKLRASHEKAEQVEKFLDRHADYPFAYHARGQWLGVLAARHEWEDYLRFFDGRENTRLQCLAFQARLKLGKFENLNDDISRVWLRGYSQPSECDPAFAYFLENHDQPQQALWLRIEKAFEARRPNLARYLGRKLGKSDQAIVETWYRAHLRPERSLKKLADAPNTERNRAIIVHAIERLARKDSLKALEHWNLIRDHFAFSPEQRNRSQLRIALSAAYQHEPEALSLLSNLDSSVMNDQAYLWLARMQLRSRDWS